MFDYTNAGLVEVFREPYEGFPKLAIADHGYQAGDRAGYFAVGGFTIANHNGCLLAPSLFLRDACRHRLDRKSARGLATDIMHWCRFVEAVQSAGRQPPYAYDLFDVDEETLEKFKVFLQRGARNARGQPLATNTIRQKLMRVCHMYQWLADCGWYLKDLGPRAEMSRMRRSGAPMLAHIEQKGRGTARLGPMGSALASSAQGRSSQKLPRALTERDQKMIAEVHRQRLSRVAKGTPRYCQYVRDELIYNVGRTVGLRVENIARIPTSQILSISLDHLADSDEVTLSFMGKFNRAIRPAFTVALLRQLRTYAEDIRPKALHEGRKETEALFLVHVGASRGRALTPRGVQSAMADLFIEAGLHKLEPKRARDGSLVFDNAGNPVLRPASLFSVHDLRHTCAARRFYANLSATGDRLAAMRAVQAQLCHAAIETTEKEYAEFTRRFSNWDEFCAGLNLERDADLPAAKDRAAEVG